MSDQATSTLASGLISTGLVLGIVFRTRHMTTAMSTMKSSEPKPCQSVPNCWTFSENDCFGTAVVLIVPLPLIKPSSLALRSSTALATGGSSSR